MKLSEAINEEQAKHLETLLDNVANYLTGCVGSPVELVTLVHKKHEDGVECQGTAVVAKQGPLAIYMMLQQAATSLEPKAKQEYFLRNYSGNEMPA